MIYRFDSEFEPVTRLKLKIEINTREHISVFGFRDHEYKVKSKWFTGECRLKTYTAEELLSTKLRAMYQRKKGRDLFDIWYACENLEIDPERVVEGFNKYLKNAGSTISLENYLTNMEQKIEDDEFLGDTTALLRTDINYDHSAAWELVKGKIINRI